jgi:hypothetical protein
VNALAVDYNDDGDRVFTVRDSSRSSWSTLNFVLDMQEEESPEQFTRGCIQKFPDWVDKEIYAYLWYYSLKSNTKGYGRKISYTDSQDSDTTEPNIIEL